MDEQPKSEAEPDLMRELCIEQGYVPPTCQLAGPVVYMLVSMGEDPCAGCNNDRAICHGRPKSGRYV